MNARIATVLAVTAVGTVTAGQPSGTPQRPAFRAATDAVLVPVAVTRGREPALGLDVADFALFDNGVRQTIDSVDATALPIDVTIVLDSVPERDLDRLATSRLDADMVRSQLREPDRVRIISTGTVPRDVVALQPAATAPALPGIARTRGSSALDGLFYALARPVETGRRHLVVMFTRADDTWSTLDADRLPALAMRADAVMHVVFFDGIPGLPAAPDAMRPEPQGARIGDDRTPPPASWMPPRMGENRRTEPRNNMMPAARDPNHVVRVRRTYWVLVEVARRTGGGTHLLRDRVAAFTRILDDFRSSYLLRYTPTGVDLPGWHDIEVRVTRPGRYDVRARKGYEGSRPR